MNNPIPCDPGAMSRAFHAMSKAVLLPVLVFALTNQAMRAGSATWDLNPANSDWNTATNWTPNTVPNGPADTATFALSNTTAVSVSTNLEVNGIVFNPGASPFNITIGPPTGSFMTISGVGIANNSGGTQTFVTSVDSFGHFGWISFTNSASAGSATFINNGTAVESAAGYTNFYNSSTAANAIFFNDAGGFSGGIIQFWDTSTAGNGTFTSYGGAVSGDLGGETRFYGNSTAASSTLTAEGGVRQSSGGVLWFIENSTAGNATLSAEGDLDGGGGGFILFDDNSTGGTARVEVFGKGNLDISGHNARGLTIGSLEGDGLVFLGHHNLIVGSNNLTTTFGGVISEFGSLTKMGGGKLSLTNANTYTGGTTVSRGTLLVRNVSGSGTGSGPVNVNAGSLGGIGIIAGAVTLGTGAGHGATLSPGSRVSLGTLTIQSTLTFKADATYDFALNSSRLASDQIAANGVTIESGAMLTFVDNGTATLPLGTAFTAINNTAATRISGAFSNLADGSTITAGSNTFQANYEGGDGNDLILTVIP